jgi:hypothetical protein
VPLGKNTVGEFESMAKRGTVLALETKQSLGKNCAKSPFCNQQQAVLRANNNSYRKGYTIEKR